MKRLSYDYIKKEGYTLLTQEYKNNNQKLDYICPNGHKHSIQWNAWQQGCRCFHCVHNEIANKRRLDYSFIKSQFASEGYTLLTKKYKNAFQKLEFICPNGHKHSITWSNWQQGQRCSYCAGLAKKTIEEIKQAFESEGYKLLTREYKNCYQKLDFICPNNHKHSIRWNDWKKGVRCSYSANEKRIKYYSKEDLERYDTYRKITDNLTKRIYRKYKSYINPNNYRRERYSYHLDHIYSVIDGFENNVPVDIISNPNNLRMILADENLNKNGNSYITKMLLYHIAI